MTSISNGSVAFIGSGSGGQTGIYSGSGGVPAALVDTTTLIPNGTGDFTGFSFAVVKGSSLAFVGSGSGGQGGVRELLSRPTRDHGFARRLQRHGNDR